MFCSVLVYNVDKGQPCGLSCEISPVSVLYKDVQKLKLEQPRMIIKTINI